VGEHGARAAAAAAAAQGSAWRRQGWGGWLAVMGTAPLRILYFPPRFFGVVLMLCVPSSQGPKTTQQHLLQATVLKQII
jgi:hypothetical protein